LFKISFPAEFHSQTAVEAAMTLHGKLAETGKKVEDIKKITIRTHEAAIRIIDKKGPLDNPADRDHCIQYMIAVPLIHGRLTASDYEDGIAKDQRIDTLRAKMECVEDPQFTKDYHDPEKRSIANALTVEFNDGSKFDENRRRISDWTQAPSRRRHPPSGREVQDQSGTAFPSQAARGDPRGIAGSGNARSNAGQ
jgi:2-methylcitrate dehydratase